MGALRGDKDQGEPESRRLVVVPSAGEEEASEDPGRGVFDVNRPLGVYVHFPFCGVHCPYCDFAVDDRAAIPHDAYADAVVRELEARAAWFRADGDRPRLRSIYFGGGTPGLWRPDALARVLGAIASAFPRRDDLFEVTVEVNPGETAGPGLEALLRAGVTRLSIGAQSFDDGELGRLGRNHDAAAIPRAFATARAAGFSNLTADLMFGVPGQSRASWRRSLAGLLALEPSHISAYALTIETGTRFANDERAGRLVRADDEEVSAMFLEARATLGAAGYEHYEISSYARPGARAVHNQLYWTQGAYLGLGASAASFRPLVGGEGWRFSNPRGTESYLRAATAPGGPRPAKVEARTRADLENEALWLALRTRDGVDRVAHAARFGADPLAPPARRAAADECVRARWLELDQRRIRLSDDGLLFADEVAARLWDG